MLIPTGTNGKHPRFPKFISMKFPKFATNLAMSLHSCQSNRELQFHAEICWEVAKFVAREVRVIRCSWFGNLTTNECKQSENICQPSNTSWNVNYLRYRETSHHRRMARVASGLQRQCKYKSSATWQWNIFCFFALFLEWCMSCEKVFLSLTDLNVNYF